jgi:transcriptional regulator with XRE-family HTH domain
VDTKQLGEFLRSRRESITPDEAGIGSGERRRTPGLRREEVASLASVSTDYVARLEQDRATLPSAEVLASLARALRLSLDERDQLFRLGGKPIPVRARDDDHVSPTLLTALDRLTDIPAQVMTDLGVTLAQNRLAVAVFGDARPRSGERRNVIYRWFTDPIVRDKYPDADQDDESRALVADLRAAITRRDDAPGRALVDALLRDSPEFAVLWERQDVEVMRQRRKRIINPLVGELDFECQSLLDPDRAQILALFAPTPDTPTAERLARLADASATNGSSPS